MSLHCSERWLQSIPTFFHNSASWAPKDPVEDDSYNIWGYRTKDLSCLMIVCRVMQPFISHRCFGYLRATYPAAPLCVGRVAHWKGHLCPETEFEIGWWSLWITTNHFYYLIVGCTFQAFHYYPKWNYHSQWWGMPGIRGQGGIPTNSWALL